VCLTCFTPTNNSIVEDDRRPAIQKLIVTIPDLHNSRGISLSRISMFKVALHELCPTVLVNASKLLS
jgi:hypothetical protein